jgi:hypothetical protein
MTAATKIVELSFFVVNMTDIVLTSAAYSISHEH